MTGRKKHPGGRPPLPDSKRRDHRITVRFAQEDIELLTSRAEERQCDVATLVYDLTLESLWRYF